MTRVLTGQLDAYVEPGPRILEELPETRSEFERVGGGAVLNNSPYDLAAATLCLEEGGAIVTDAAGRSLGDRPLLGSAAEYQMSVVASANPRLHEKVLSELDAGMTRLAFSFAGTAEPESG
jgi:myo-inositol-1(or 4)-monophosphatase